MNRLSLAFVLAFAMAFSASAQQPVATTFVTLPDAPSTLLADSEPAPQQTSPAQVQEQQPAPSQSQKELSQEEKQRMLGVIPNFNAVMSGSAEPLTSKQKFSLFLKDAFDPFDFAAAALDAGLEQHANDYPEWGGGFGGYAKRYGASFADEFDTGFWANAVLPSVLHQDPRYFRLGKGSLPHRFVYSVLFVVRCKGDNGHWQPNYSNIGGSLIGGAISNAYYPASDRGLGLTLENGFTVAGEGAISTLASEFYPDVIALFHRHRKATTLTP